MTRYYVYHVQTDGGETVNVFVDSPAKWSQATASKLWDVTFSGISVEAESIEEAIRIYQSPNEDDVIMSCDEPCETKLAREANKARRQVTKEKLAELHEALNMTERRAREARLVRHALVIGTMLREMNRLMSSMSRDTKAIYGDKASQLSVETFYEQITKRYAEELRKFTYRPDDDGETPGKTGSTT